jgi:hypothetical protein
MFAKSKPTKIKWPANPLGFAEGSIELRAISTFKVLSQYWTLAGGGALVYHLRHRHLKELDFFLESDSWDDNTANFTADIIARVMGSSDSERQKANEAFFNAQHGVLKVGLADMMFSFVLTPKVKGTLNQIQSPDAIPIASLEDVVGGKLFTLPDRKNLTDYLDWIAIINAGITPTQATQFAKNLLPMMNGSYDVRQCFEIMHSPPEEIRTQLTAEQLSLLASFAAANV